jgi:uncharacterized protein
MLFLVVEFALLFILLPVLVYFRRLPNYPIPALLVATVFVLLYLRHEPTFHTSELTSWGGTYYLWPLLIRDGVLLIALTIAVCVFARDRLFSLIKQSPLLWLAVFVLYPLISVYPQELLYRTFFFHRYQPLFGSGWGMITASALAFSFVHIIFRHWLPVILCILGGFLFALTYHISGSLLLTCLDHAIFGNFLFTIGLGEFFYHGSIRTLSRSPFLSPKSPLSR